MPPPISVELVPHSPSWKVAASDETVRLLHALAESVVAIHHIGSTAIPGIHAKPIIDLLLVARSITELDRREPVFKQLGYSYWGEYGISGRRYCTLDDPTSGRRRIQIHSFESGHHEIERHLAFRDYLRSNSLKAKEYDLEKHRCRDLHPKDSHAYSDAKAGWITAQLPEALARFRSSS